MIPLHMNTITIGFVSISSVSISILSAGIGYFKRHQVNRHATYQNVQQRPRVEWASSVVISQILIHLIYTHSPPLIGNTVLIRVSSLGGHRRSKSFYFHQLRGGLRRRRCNATWGIQVKLRGMTSFAVYLWGLLDASGWKRSSTAACSSVAWKALGSW